MKNMPASTSRLLSAKPSVGQIKQHGCLQGGDTTEVIIQDSQAVQCVFSSRGEAHDRVLLAKVPPVSPVQFPKFDHEQAKRFPLFTSKLPATKRKFHFRSVKDWAVRLQYQLEACRRLEKEVLAAADARYFRNRQRAIRKQLATLNQTA